MKRKRTILTTVNIEKRSHYESLSLPFQQLNGKERTFALAGPANQVKRKKRTKGEENFVF